MRRPALLVALGLSACPAPTPIEPPPPVCAGCDLTHPIDAVLASTFATEGVEPWLASPAELCRRLGFDLVGRPLRPDERADCEGAVDRGEVDAAIVGLQAEDDYLLVSMRVAADRFGTDDVIVDFRATVDLYDHVTALHRGAARYDEFLVELLRHPGLMLADFALAERVDRVMRATHFRPANDAERQGLANLFRPWLADFEGQDEELPILRRRAYVLPSFCEPTASCSTSMWGGASVDLSFIPAPQRATPIYADSFDAQTEAALAVPGRLFAAQPAVYEAYAEHLLNRFIDWDDGERDIRTPGHLFPAVRAAVAAHLQETGDVPAAERLVLTSLLYTQAADVADGDGVTLDAAGALPSPLFVGPLKPMSPEAWIATVMAKAGFEVGRCDPRFADGFSYAMVYDAFVDDDGAIQDGAAYNAAMQRLFELRRDFGRLDPSGTFGADGTELLDYARGALFIARQLGGCPGFGTPRQRPAGLAFALTQDNFAALLCDAVTQFPIGNPDRESVRGIIDEQWRNVLGRNVTDDELALAVAASGCSALGEGDCAPAALATRTCLALATSTELTFY